MHVLLRGDWRQRARLISGLILFTFATTHFLNHALGLFDLKTMYEVQQWRWLVTRSWPGSIILASALVTHIVLALDKLSDRMTLRLPTWELVQLILGFSIPFLLLPHIVNTRVAREFFGVNDTYLYELARLWPDSAILQSTLLLIVWIHGCIGIHFWLRLSAPYRKFQPVLLFVAILIPIAALGGFMVGGRAVAQMIADPKSFDEVKQLSHWPNPENGDRLAAMRLIVRLGFAAMLATALALLVWPSNSTALLAALHHRLRRRRCRELHIRPDAARNQPNERHPPRVRLRRPRQMLDVPGSRRGRCQLSATRDISRSRHTRKHWSAAERPPRLPDAAARPDDRHPAATALYRRASRCR